MKDMEMFKMATSDDANSVNEYECEKTLHYISFLGMSKKELLLAVKDNEYEIPYYEIEPLLDFKTHLWEPFT